MKGEKNKSKQAEQWDAFLKKRRAEEKCCCWDCLRAEGYTPPLSRRSRCRGNHPFTIFGEDIGGEPVITESNKKKEGDETKGEYVQAAKESNLRGAHRERAVM